MPNNDDIFKYGIEIGKGLPKTVSMDVTPRQEISAEKYKEYQKAIGEQNIPFDEATLQEMAYQAQSTPGLVLKGIGRAGAKAIEEVLSIPGYAAAPFTGWDNAWLQTIKGGAEAFRDAAVPVYVSNAIQEGGILGKMLSASWWASTGADGIGFMAAMFAPGAAMKALNVGKVLTGTAGAIGRGAELLGGTAVTAADLTNVGNKMSGLGRLAKWGKTIQSSAAAADVANSAMTVAANTYIEAAAEANSSYLSTRDKLLRDNPNMSEEEANRIAGDAASNVFGANLGILGISNYIIERYVFKGFNARASAVNRLKGAKLFAGEGTAARGVAREAAAVGAEAVQEGAEAAGKGFIKETAGKIKEKIGGGIRAMTTSKTPVALTELTEKGFFQKAREAAWGGFKGAISEGLWEEGMQTSAEQYFNKQALEGGDLSQPWNIPGNLWNIAGKWAKNVSEMETTQESKEFYEAAVLGGILGGGMTTAGDFSGIGEREKLLFGTPEVKAREKFMGSKRLAKGMDRLTNRTPKEASPGLIQEFKSKIEASTIKLEDILVPKADGTGYEINEDGTYAIDESKLGAISEAGKNLAVSMAQLAAYEQALGDKKIDGTINLEETQELEKLKHRREMFLLNQYINMEGGADLFNDHVDEIVDRFIAKQFEDSPTATLNAGERAQERERLKGKVKRLSKLNEVIKNTHIDNMGVLIDEPGTPEDKELFSRLRLNEKASQGAYLDNLDYQIKEKKNEIQKAQSFGEENTVDRAVAEARNKELEILEKQKKEQQQVYQDLFNKDKIKESYNKFLKQQDEFNEAQKEIERIIQEFQSPDYIKNLFEKEGYDYENDTDLRVNILDKDDNIAFGIDIEKNNNGDRVLTFTSEQGNKFYLTKEGEKLSWLPYDGTQITPRNIEEEFYQTYKGSIQIEKKEKRKQRIETEESEFINKQKELLTEAVEDLVDSMQEQRQNIQGEIDKLSAVEKKIKERISAEELVKNLEKEIDELIRRRKKKGLKQKEAAIKEAKKKLEELSKSAEELKNALGEDLNEINKIEERLRELQNKQKEIDKKIFRLVDQKQRIEAIANKEEAANYRDYVAKQLIKEAFEKENFSDADLDILASSISVLPKTLNEFIANLEKSKTGNFERMFGEVFGKTEELKNNIESSKKDLDEVQKRIEEAKAKIEFLEKKIEAINKDIASKLSNRKSRIINTQLKELEEKQLVAQNKIQEEESKRLIEIKQLLSNLQAKESELTAARKELFDRFIDIKDALEIPKQIVEQIAKTNKRKAEEVIKQQSVEVVENKEKAIEEESKNRRVPNTPFVLTGIDVLMEGGKDKVDENGNVVLNSNPYARNWFDFTSDIIMNKEKMSDYEFVITSLNAKDLDPEIKNQIEESFRLSPGLTDDQKKEALFVFVKKKGTKGPSYFYQRSGKYVFTSLRSIENIENKFELDAASRLRIRNEMTEKNRENFDKSSESEKQEMLEKIKNKMIEEYKKTLTALRETLKTTKAVKVNLFNTPEVRHLNFRFENNKPVKNKVSEVFPFLFEGGKFPKINIGTTEFVEVKNSKGGMPRIYRIPVGMPYVEVGGIPVVLHQNKLTDEMIDTVIALYAEFAGKKGLDHTIDGYDIIGNNNKGLLGTIVSYGTGKNNNSAELYVKKGRVVYGLKRDSRSISLDLLNKYTQGVEELTENEKSEIESLKNYLASRYININKNYVDQKGTIVMPVFNKETRKIDLVDVNYKAFVFKKVATIPLDKNRPFVQVNFAIDKTSLDKKLVEIKLREEPNDLLKSVEKELIANTTQVVDYTNNELEKEIERLFSGKNKKDLEAVKERLDKSNAGGSYEGVKKYLIGSLQMYKTKEDMLRALDNVARNFIRTTVKNKRELNPKIRIAAMLLYVNRVRESLNTNKMSAGAAAVQNQINEPLNTPEQELTPDQEKEMLNDIFGKAVSSSVTEEDFESPSTPTSFAVPMPTSERQVAAQPVVSQQPQVGEFVFPRMEGESEIDYGNRMFVPFVEHEDKKLRSMGIDARHQYVINTYLTETDRSYFEKDSQANIEKDFTNEIVGRFHLFGFTKVENLGNGNYRFFYNVARRNEATQKFEITNEERHVDFNPANGVNSFFDLLRNNDKPQFNYFLQNLVTRYAQQEIDKPLVNEEELNPEEKKFVEQERERLKKEREVKESKQSEQPTPSTPPSAPVQPEKGFVEIRRPRRPTTSEQPTPPPVSPTPSAPVTPVAILPAILPTKQSVLLAFQNKVELGRGGNAIVYDIPRTDFVLRVPKGSEFPTTSDEIVAVADPFDGRNFGQPIATIGQSQILHRQSGIPAGLTNYRNLTQEEADEQYVAATIAAASMPQSAYDKFAADLMFLNSRGALFDGSKSNNVLIDSNSGQFNLVDINQDKPKNVNNEFSTIVVTLMGTTYAWQYKGKTDLTNLRKQIYDKALAAAKKTGLPFSEDSSTKYSQELAGIKTPTQKDKIITLDEAKSILKNLQESDQVTKKCE